MVIYKKLAAARRVILPAGVSQEDQTLFAGADQPDPMDVLAGIHDPGNGGELAPAPAPEKPAVPPPVPGKQGHSCCHQLAPYPPRCECSCCTFFGCRQDCLSSQPVYTCLPACWVSYEPCCCGVQLQPATGHRQQRQRLRQRSRRQRSRGRSQTQQLSSTASRASVPLMLGRISGFTWTLPAQSR